METQERILRETVRFRQRPVFEREQRELLSSFAKRMRICTLKTEQRNVKRSKVLEDCKSQVKETDCYDSPKRDKRIT